MELEKNKTYWWYVDKYNTKKQKGTFTGEYDQCNLNAILKTEKGEEWSIPIKDLFASKKTQQLKKEFGEIK